jgi:hypothetical protein
VVPEQAKSYYAILKDHPGFTLIRFEMNDAREVSEAVHAIYPLLPSLHQANIDYWVTGNEFSCCINF